jgi:hypothetical protein
MKQTPRITFSPLTRRWYVVTRYTMKTSASGTTYLSVREKHDVTDQMKAILKGYRTPAQKRRAAKQLRAEM